MLYEKSVTIVQNNIRNDLPLLADHCNFVLFADDSSVFFSDKGVASL